MSDHESGPVTERDDDIALPKATTAKLVQEHLPTGMTCAKDAKDMIADAGKEFIVLVATEAHDICEKASKKTMGPEHIAQALKTLGFDKYVSQVEDATNDHKQVAKERTKSAKFNKTSMTDAELEAEQAKLFAASAAKYENPTTENTAADNATSDTNR